MGNIQRVVDQRFFSTATRLGAADAKRVIVFADKYLKNQELTGFNFEHIKRGNGFNLYTARISKELRAVICRVDGTDILIHTAHHDDAYDWIDKQRFVTHGGNVVILPPKPKPGGQDDSGQTKHPKPTQSTSLFEGHSDDYLMSLGVPENWLEPLRKISDNDTLLDFIMPLNTSVQDCLLRLAIGEIVAPPIGTQDSTPTQSSTSIIYVSKDQAELQKVLDQPLSAWMAFLHPEQERIVHQEFKGPAKVTGSAGTGKTVVGFHRARYLARQKKRVLMTSFVTTLCQNISKSLKYFCSPEELKYISVRTVNSEAFRLIREGGDFVSLMPNQEVLELVSKFHKQVDDCPLDDVEIKREWELIINRLGISTWDEYASVSRTGRRVPLNKGQREKVWQVFEPIFDYFIDNGKLDNVGFYRYARELIEEEEVESPYDCVIVDEVQDLDRQALLFIKALAQSQTNNLLLLGDEGQRIYGPGFRLSHLGIETRGRSSVLRVNYRTTAEIREFADAILGSETDDMDGGKESRRIVQSLLNGPAPTLQGFEHVNDEANEVVKVIQSYLGGTKVGGKLSPAIQSQDIAIFARTNYALKPFEKALSNADIPWSKLAKDDDHADVPSIKLGSMHRAKGLEFKIVFVVEVNEKNMPYANILKEFEQDEAEYNSILLREKHLLYVSLTRARDRCYVFWSGTSSPFLPNAYLM